MEKRRLLGMKLWLGAAAVLLGVPAACSPTERNFGSGGSGGGGGGGDPASSSVSSSSTAASSSSVASSSSAGTGGAGGNGCPVDADKDGYVSIACGGKDCVDTDERAHPGQTMWFTTPIAAGLGFDYNCDGMEEREWVEVVSCSLLNCDTNTKKWAKSPPPSCGMMGDFGACQVVGNNCVPVITGTRVQACH